VSPAAPPCSIELPCFLSREFLHTGLDIDRLGRYGFQQYLAAVYACYDELRATKGLASKVRDYLRRKWKDARQMDTSVALCLEMAGSLEEHLARAAFRIEWRRRGLCGELH
jgi:hypothetical protein